MQSVALQQRHPLETGICVQAGAHCLTLIVSLPEILYIIGAGKKGWPVWNGRERRPLLVCLMHGGGVPQPIEPWNAESSLVPDEIIRGQTLGYRILVEYKTLALSWMGMTGRYILDDIIRAHLELGGRRASWYIVGGPLDQISRFLVDTCSD